MHLYHCETIGCSNCEDLFEFDGKLVCFDHHVQARDHVERQLREENQQLRRQISNNAFIIPKEIVQSYDCGL